MLKYALRRVPVSVSDSLTWNCHLSGGNLRCMQSVAQHACPWQPGSGESIWVRKDNPLTPKEDWRISQALMSCELVFISPHKNGAVCVTASALQHNHRVTESIMGNCYLEWRKQGNRWRTREKGRMTAEDVLVSSLLISLHILGFREMM